MLIKIQCALCLLWKENRRLLFVNYIQTPIGIAFLLVWIWGVDLVIKLLPFQFPSPIVTMIGLFALMMSLHALSDVKIVQRFIPSRNGRASMEESTTASTVDTQPQPKFLMEWFLLVMGPTLDWLSAYMPMFFTPSFILVPSREVIPGKDIGLIIAWFIPSFILAWTFNVYLCKLTSMLPFFHHTSLKDSMDHTTRSPNTNEKDQSISEKNEPDAALATILTRDSQATSQTVDAKNANSSSSRSNVDLSDKSREDLESALEVDDQARADSSPAQPGTRRSSWCSADVTRAPSPQRLEPRSSYIAPDSDLSRDCEKLPAGSSTKPDQIGLPTPVTAVQSPAERLANNLQPWIDPFFYSIMLFIGFFVFYFPPSGSAGRAFALFTSINSLTYLASVRAVPDKWKKIMHPILVSSVTTCLLIWAIGATVGWSLKETLRLYSTSTTYIELFSPDWWDDGGKFGPGAGDLLTSLLDAGIVSLALPLYRYRNDLRVHFPQMACIIIPNCVLSLLFWPLIPGQLAMGLPWERAVVFAGRFMSTPLAIELVSTSGGDESLTVVLVVVTGILAVLTKDHLFRWMKVSVDDTLTVGMTTGIIAGAIGTSSLIKSNPKAMASATVGFVGYGLVLLCLIAVPPIAGFVRTVAGG